eukprot:CAMPEP_0171197844 /NCGR_PEP_ID=MMETSP0790-20130122/22619_1 /TAXON_ID=2925 /ORGANISM="Alexandrium catenella, Strain OF101" /LENGTH=210 /DNA_ID=CAMNT_0011663095 /DNA_START=61 /DNA_END=693 /DNA_ORIENTATION=+
MAPLRLLCTLALAPVLPALRVEPAGSVAQLMTVTEDQEAQGPPGHIRQPKIKIGKELALHWNVTAIERGSQMALAWDHGCEYGGKAMGQCIFRRDDSRFMPGLTVKVATPLKDDALFKATVTSKALGHEWSMKLDCKVCNDKCVADFGFGPKIEVDMPPCPLPEGGFDLTLPTVNVSEIPLGVSVHSVIDSRLERADGSQVAEVIINAWV